MQVVTDLRSWQLAMRGLENGMPRAVAGALNKVGGLVDKGQEMNVRRTFTLRNPYTMRSLKRWKASPKPDIDKINTIVGSFSPYMAIQDTGGERRPVRGKHVPIPTRAARGGDWKSPILRRYALKESVQFGQVKMTKSGRRSKSSNTIFVLPRSSRAPAGIFTRVGGRLVRIRTLGAASYQLRGTHWHTGAVEKYGTLENIERAFIAEAKRIIGGE